MIWRGTMLAMGYLTSKVYGVERPNEVHTARPMHSRWGVEEDRHHRGMHLRPPRLSEHTIHSNMSPRRGFDLV